MKYQKFRFCCACQRLSLITQDGCFVCGGTFIVDGTKPDSYLNNIPKYNQKKINNQKLKNHDKELQH